MKFTKISKHLYLTAQINIRVHVKHDPIIKDLKFLKDFVIRVVFISYQHREEDTDYQCSPSRPPHVQNFLT